MDGDGYPMKEAEGNRGGGQWKHEDKEPRGQGSGWTPIQTPQSKNERSRVQNTQ